MVSRNTSRLVAGLVVATAMSGSGCGRLAGTACRPPTVHLVQTNRDGSVAVANELRTDEPGRTLKMGNRITDIRYLTVVATAPAATVVVQFASDTSGSVVFTYPAAGTRPVDVPTFARPGDRLAVTAQITRDGCAGVRRELGHLQLFP